VILYLLVDFSELISGTDMIKYVKNIQIQMKRAVGTGPEVDDTA